MRIPKYDAQISAPSAPRFNQTVDLRSDTFSKIADGLDNYRDYRIKQLEEETKTEYYKADISAKYELEDAHSKMIDAIQNGGAYSGAEEKYQKTHDAIVQKYGKIFSGDQNAYERQMMDFKQYGLQHTVQLRNAVQARRKSDARQAYSLREQQASAKFLDNPQEAIQMMTQATAGLRGTGILTDDGAKAEIAQFVKKNTANKIQYFAQNNSTNPQAVLDLVEAEKSNLDIDMYLNLRGAAMKDVEQANIVDNAFRSILENPLASKQEEVDLVFDDILKKGIDSSKPEYNQSIIQLTQATNKIPTQIQSQIEQIISLPPDDIKQADAATFANIAAITKEMPPSALAKMSDYSQAAINFVNDSVDAGIPIETAVKQAAKAMSSFSNPEKADEEFDGFKNKILYKDGRDYLAEKVDQTVVGRLFETKGLSLLPGQQGFVPDPKMRSLYETRSFIYKQMGDSVSSAEKKAYSDVSKIYQPYKGKMVKYSPTAITGLSEESFENNAILKPLKKTGLYNEGYKYQIVSDSQTELEYLSGQNVTYPLFYENEGGVLSRVLNKDNLPLRTMPLKQSGFKPFFSAGPLLLTEEDRELYKQGKLKPWLRF